MMHAVKRWQGFQIIAHTAIAAAARNMNAFHTLLITLIDSLLMIETLLNETLLILVPPVTSLQPEAVY